MEKEDVCPVCNGELSQSEYDLQYHKDHWGPFGKKPNKKFTIMGCPQMIANSRKG